MDPIDSHWFTKTIEAQDTEWMMNTELRPEQVLLSEETWNDILEWQRE